MIQQQIFALQDKPYGEFQSRLLPTIAKDYRSSYSGHEKAGKAVDEGGAGGGAGISGRASPYIL